MPGPKNTCTVALEWLIKIIFLFVSLWCHVDDDEMSTCEISQLHKMDST